MIDDRAVAAYRTQGFVVVPDVLDAAELDALRATVGRILDAARGIAAHDDVYDLEPDHRPEAPRVRRIKTPHRHDRAFWDLARSDRLVAILRRLLGTDDIRLHGSKINMKAARGGAPVEWHQDWAFYPHTNDDLLAVGVMLDDCTEANGAMLVLPETHRGPVYDHHADGHFCGAMDVGSVALDFSTAVSCTGRAGSMSFHHVRAVHGSAQNLSDRPRALLLYEFAAADAWPLLGVKDFAEYESRMVAGRSTLTPRLAPVPVRLPLPPAPHQGSIYENQASAKNRYFGRKEAA